MPKKDLFSLFVPRKIILAEPQFRLQRVGDINWLQKTMSFQESHSQLMSL